MKPGITSCPPASMTWVPVPTYRLISSLAADRDDAIAGDGDRLRLGLARLDGDDLAVRQRRESPAEPGGCWPHAAMRVSVATDSDRAIVL